MNGPRITRGTFLAGAAAGVAGLAGVSLPARAAQTRGAEALRRFGLTYRGVAYNVTDGETPHTSWQHARMAGDVRAIAQDLHASSISVYGDGPERLAATAAQAAEHGLHVWLQPRVADRPHREILDHLAAVGERAEELRKQGANVHLSVGAEFFLFVPGMVPGDTALDRVKRMLSGNYDRDRMLRRQDRFVARAARVGRSVFDGPLSYGAAQDHRIDWSLFDIVSANYYPTSARRADRVRELRRFKRWGKPVAITEFGTCPYKGAPRRAGLAWKVVDYGPPERIARKLVRSERTQADYLIGLLDVFEALGLYSATAFEFVTPDAPHRDNPRRDLDLASYGITKTIWKSRTRPTADWHWEPKLAFHALARHYRQAREQGSAATSRAREDAR